MTKIILIRHGESLGNAVHRLLGHTDLDLSPLGYRQADVTAAALKNEKIDVIYSSDLLRAMNTAKPHGELHALSVNPSRGLREIYLGEWEGMSSEAIIEKYGDMYKVDWLGGFGTFRFPGGESTAEAGERFYREAESIAKKEEGKTVLIAAHAAVIRSFFAKVLEIPAEKIAAELPFPTNASYSEVFFEGEKFRAGKFSVDDHLSGVGITKYE